MNPLQSVVTCADCGRQYKCSPLDDHYLRAGDPEGSPRVCFTCLVSTANQVGSMRPRSELAAPRVVMTDHGERSSCCGMTVLPDPLDDGVDRCSGCRYPLRLT